MNPIDLDLWAYRVLLLTLLLLLQNVVDGIQGPNTNNRDGGYINVRFKYVVHIIFVDMTRIVRGVLYDFWLTHLLAFLDNGVEYWMKPKSTMWFS